MENEILKLQGWIARDKDNRLFFHFNKPNKLSDKWLSSSPHWLIQKEDDCFIDKVKWEDEEPLSIKLHINI